MKRLGLALIFLLSSCALVGNVEVPGGKLAVAQNTWKIHCPGGGHGSAFPVKCDKVEGGQYEVTFLTAGHVVRNRPEFGWRVTKRSPSFEMMFLGVVLSRHLSRDAALVLFISDDPVPVTYVSRRIVSMGETLWAVGYPSGSLLNISHGIAASDQSCSAPVYPGNSGGPVVDCRGAVVGIVKGIWRTSEGVLIPHTMVFTRTADITSWLRHHGVPSL